jgi:hypothetical protein
VASEPALAVVAGNSADKEIQKDSKRPGAAAAQPGLPSGDFA